VFERALDVEPADVRLWLAYTEMVCKHYQVLMGDVNHSHHMCGIQELKARNVQHARNLFDRAVTLLPRIDQIWFK
jgi:crooked neck